MSLVVICDRCGKTIGDEQNRVLLTAVRYTLADQTQAEVAPPPQVPASAPPGTIITAPGSVAPMGVSGSSQQFTTSPAFDGQMEMHEDCWDRWVKGEEDPPAASEDRETALARQAAEREEASDEDK